MQAKSPEEELARAGAARQLLDDPLFIEACKRIEEGLSSQRRSVPMRDSEMHTRLILAEQIWGNLKDYLEQTAQTGKFAEFEIARRKGVLDLFTRR